jgi:hypothetical protein
VYRLSMNWRNMPTTHQNNCESLWGTPATPSEVGDRDCESFWGTEQLSRRQGGQKCLIYLRKSAKRTQIPMSTHSDPQMLSTSHL